MAVRNLLQISDSCLRINGFIDPWNEQKSIENHISLSKLSERLDELDQSQNKEEKWMEIFKGIFAGNVFDWGALVNIFFITDGFQKKYQFNSIVLLGCCTNSRK